MYDSSSSMVEVGRRTHEIVAKFRPIAPKPSPVPPTQLPPCLRSRPSRARKRTDRNALVIPNNNNKRQHRLLAHHSHLLLFAGNDINGDSLLLPPTPPPSKATNVPPPPVERDLLNKLVQQPRIVVPRPLRPVGSSISVVPSSIVSVAGKSTAVPEKSSLKEVEEMVELSDTPAVVSDIRNKVMLVNTAYKEMVGQPECMWLDSVVEPGGGGGGNWIAGSMKRRKGTRINGEVAIIGMTDPTKARTVEGEEEDPRDEGFSCRVKVEWVGACSGGEKRSVDAACDVVRVRCAREDSSGKQDACFFTWMIHTAG